MPRLSGSRFVAGAHFRSESASICAPPPFPDRLTHSVRPQAGYRRPDCVRVEFRPFVTIPNARGIRRLEVYERADQWLAALGLDWDQPQLIPDDTERELLPLIETLADAGVCPTNGDRVLKTQHVQHCLSLICSCGMYDFLFEVGLPAKSGVGGAILAAIPNVMGLCTWRTPRDMNTSRSTLSTRDCHSHRGPAGKGLL